MVSKTLYWGIKIPDNVFEDEYVREILSSDERLIKKSELHCTLLYVGRKQNDEEARYFELENVPCTVHCDAIGYSDKAAALRVSRIVHEFGDIEYDMERVLHVTLALGHDVKPKDAVHALIGGGSLIMLPKEMVMHGVVTRYTR